VRAHGIQSENQDFSKILKIKYQTWIWISWKSRNGLNFHFMEFQPVRRLEETKNIHESFLAEAKRSAKRSEGLARPRARDPPPIFPVSVNRSVVNFLPGWTLIL
jgi:hypothetical protein